MKSDESFEQVVLVVRLDDGAFDIVDDLATLSGKNKNTKMNRDILQFNIVFMDRRITWLDETNKLIFSVYTLVGICVWYITINTKNAFIKKSYLYFK